MSGHEQPEGERRREDRCGEGREEHGNRRDHRQLREDQHHGLQHRRVERRGVECPHQVVRRDPSHVPEHRVERGRHHRQVHGERQHEADILAEDQLRAPHRLRQQAVDAAPLDFLRHQADADEDRDEQPEQRHRGQAEILDDLHVLSRCQLPHQERARHQDHREGNNAVQHFVAHRIAEDMDRDEQRRSHQPTSRPLVSRTRATK